MEEHRGPGHIRLLCVLALGALPGFLVWRLSEGVLQGGDVFFAMGAFPLALLLSLFFLPFPLKPQIPLWLPLLSVVIFTSLGHLRLPTSVTNDEEAYIYQAEIFASGRLTEEIVGPACPDGVSHCPTHRRQLMERKNEDGISVRYAKYPPGVSLAIAPFSFLGIPFLAVLLASILDIWLLTKLARRFGIAAPAWPPLLLATTPFFLLVQSSFQSEVFTLPAALLGYLCLLRLRDKNGTFKWNAIALGAAAGWIFLCRPLTGVVFGVACLPGLLRNSESNPAPGWRAIIYSILGGLPFLVGAIIYNRLQTGEWLLSTYHAYALRFGPFDQEGAPLDIYGNGEFISGVVRQLGRWSVGVFGILGMAALAIWGLWKSRARDGGSAFLITIGIPIAYSFHWYPGHWAYLGPLYCFETIGFLTLGVFAILDRAPGFWRRGLPLAATIAGITFFVHRYRLSEEIAELRNAPVAFAESMEGLPANSVILLPLSRQSAKYNTPSKPPFSAKEFVYVRELPGERQTRLALKSMGLDGRPLYRFNLGGTREFDSITLVR
ncbi:MAG: glycosyltransferase family 39 protein [Planctomycetota bacterium]|nr:glycosyltransferase family 39 protein [Planctomycetota bacterium]MDP6941452.1 glycosyltransferase family 39 protein [Planctomycetota bacterium]